MHSVFDYQEWFDEHNKEVKNNHGNQDNYCLRTEMVEWCNNDHDFLANITNSVSTIEALPRHFHKTIILMLHNAFLKGQITALKGVIGK